MTAPWASRRATHRAVKPPVRTHITLAEAVALLVAAGLLCLVVLASVAGAR